MRFELLKGFARAKILLRKKVGSRAYIVDVDSWLVALVAWPFHPGYTVCTCRNENLQRYTKWHASHTWMQKDSAPLTHMNAGQWTFSTQAYAGQYTFTYRPFALTSQILRLSSRCSLTISVRVQKPHTAQELAILIQNYCKLLKNLLCLQKLYYA